MAPETYRCDRLSAIISQKQCDINKTICFVCKGCPGLGEQTRIEENNKMASHRGYCKTCDRKDRPLVTRFGDECHSCYKVRKDAEKAPAAAQLAYKAPVIKLDAVIEPVPGPVKAYETVAEPVKTYFPEDDYPADPPRQMHSEPLSRFLEPHGWLVELPRDVSVWLSEEGMSSADVVELCRMLMRGELRRMAEWPASA